jgi:hypothetical protein
MGNLVKDDSANTIDAAMDDCDRKLDAISNLQATRPNRGALRTIAAGPPAGEKIAVKSGNSSNQTNQQLKFKSSPFAPSL